MKEAALWNELHHPNVLPFYGICFGLIAPTFPGLVCPYYANHNVAEYLRMRPKTDRIAMVSGYFERYMFRAIQTV